MRRNLERYKAQSGAKFDAEFLQARHALREEFVAWSTCKAAVGLLEQRCLRAVCHLLALSYSVQCSVSFYDSDIIVIRGDYCFNRPC